MKNKKILIVGFGAIGSRHAQSLLNDGYTDLTIYDENKNNIIEGLKTIGYKKSDISLIESFDLIKCETYELAIIATSAEPRFDIYKKLLSLNIKKFILEKVVFQSDLQFDDAIKSEEETLSNSFCNFPNRYFDNYIKIKEQILSTEDQVSIFVNGGDCGIGCSGIHYLDLFEYLTGSKINLSNSFLKKWEKNNKRGNNYTDFSGIFLAKNDKNDKLKINLDNSHNGPCNVHISFNDTQIILYEGSNCEFRFSKNTKSQSIFNLLPQSKLTSIIVEDIFNNKCLLPTISQTKNIHHHLFKECNSSLGHKKLCPIT